MHVIYVANHRPHDNLDEEAIAWSLMKLGHTVTPIREDGAKFVGVDKLDADFLLFHKWEDYDVMAKVRIPMVGWYFDLISNRDDPTLARRMDVRRKWFSKVLPHCKLMFFTDGDWVDADTTGKLRFLPQGCDERVAGFGKAPKSDRGRPPILFTGMVNHGRKRTEHIERLQARYGNMFEVFGDRFGPNYRVHGRCLADLMADRIVIAPDGPGTDRYWSNRVWLTLSLGGFLLHPYCSGLKAYYTEEQLVTYHDRDQLEALIDHNLQHPEARVEAVRKGYDRTLKEHTYKQRCKELVNTVKGVL
jgi:hypothetical protein